MKSLILIAALSPGAIANSVLAAGTHAGRHGDDAIGVPGTAANVTRTIAVAMTDNMRFTPASITVRQGVQVPVSPILPMRLMASECCRRREELIFILC